MAGALPKCSAIRWGVRLPPLGTRGAAGRSRCCPAIVRCRKCFFASSFSADGSSIGSSSSCLNKPTDCCGVVHHMRSAILNLPFALGFELLNREVTFTGGMFQVLAVQDSYRSAPILDKPGLLQNPSRNANARSPCSQHARQKFVRKGQQRGTNPVLAHQQPACEAPLDFVKAIASGDLRHSKALEVCVTTQSRPKIRS